MSLVEPLEPLPLPRMPGRPMGLIGVIRAVRENSIGAYGPEAYVEPFSAVKLGWQRFVTLNEPDYIQHVLVANQANYHKGRIIRQLLGPALGEGLLTAEGETWKRNRRIAAPAFLPRRLVPVSDVVVEESEKLVARWGGRNEPFDIGPEMMGLTMAIVARALFSRDIAGLVDTLGPAITTLIEGFGRVSPIDLIGLPEWLPRRHGRETRAALRTVEATIFDILRERRAHPDEGRTDLLQMLIDARDEEGGGGFSDRQLRDELITIFAAGHETTAVALSWTWLLLDRHPSVRAKLEAELDQVLGGRAPTYADLERMPYGRMVVEEAMRLYPPAFTMNRTAINDDAVGGHPIAAGTIVSVSPWLTHRNPRLWPDPEKFDPERFRPELTKARHKYAYLPFGGGPRVCIGNGFALLEARLVLATVAQHYRLRMLPGQHIIPQARITLRPSPGVMVKVEART
jgi:cytochrome P450